MYGFIYITTNHINGKRYIGQKNYDKYDRWKDYLGSGVYLKRAVNKYGKENFSKEIIEECNSKECLDKREKYWISHYNAVDSDDFYNIALGGEGGNTIAGYSETELKEYHKRRIAALNQNRVYGEKSPKSKLTENDVKIIIERLKNNESNAMIAKDYKVGTSEISAIRNHRSWSYLTQNIEFDNIKNKRKTRKGKTVVQFDEFGNFINKFENAAVAERKTGISHKLISAVCNGDKRVAHNYIWRFDGDNFDKFPTTTKSKLKIDQYDKNGKYIATYNSLKEIKEKLSINVSPVINGKTHSAGGYYWCKHGLHFTIPEYKRGYRKLA